MGNVLRRELRPDRAGGWLKTALRAALMLTAAITGAKPKMGDHATVPTR